MLEVIQRDAHSIEVSCGISNVVLSSNACYTLFSAIKGLLSFIHTLTLGSSKVVLFFSLGV